MGGFGPEDFNPLAQYEVRKKTYFWQVCIVSEETKRVIKFGGFLQRV